MSTEDSRATRHNQRMKRQKSIVDEKIAAANIEQGVMIVISGNGKGKTTSAIGTLTRSLGHNKKCALVQFIKGDWDSGENNFLSQSANLVILQMNTGFTWDTQDFEKDKQAAEQVWQQALPLLADPSYDLLVFDELTYMLKFHYLDSQEVISAIQNRPQHQNVIVTGRGASQALIDIADTVSEINMVRHAFDQGIKAQPGIDW